MPALKAAARFLPKDLLGDGNLVLAERGKKLSGWENMIDVAFSQATLSGCDGEGDG